MCFICDGSKEGVDDPMGHKRNDFQTPMLNAPCNNPICFCYGAICCPCAACTLRKKVLEGNMDNYICCQGYIPPCCCFKPGELGEKSCPSFCLCLESFCCTSLSISSSRAYIQDALDISSDPCDRRIIRCSNCLQLLSCVCNLASIFIPEIRELAQIIDCIADLVLYTVLGCMVAQVDLEVKHFYAQNPGHAITAPRAQTIIRPKKN